MSSFCRLTDNVKNCLDKRHNSNRRLKRAYISYTYNRNTSFFCVEDKNLSNITVT